MNIRIVIADDHPVILAGVRESLAQEPGMEIVATAGNSTALVEALSKHSVDVVVTDFSMPGGEYGDGVAMIGFLRRRFPKLPLVVLTSISGVQVLASIALVTVLGRLLGLGFEIFHEPEAGMYLWARHPDIADSAVLSQSATQEGIMLGPGQLFLVEPRPTG